MCIISSKLTILFEHPFWIGIYEREYNGRYEVCKFIFGAEPKEWEVYDFMLKNWHQLKFSPSIKTAQTTEKHINPKRMQRLINKHIENTGVGTKAQQALKLQQEQNKVERKKYSREQRELEKQRQFQLNQQKRKEKHRGH